MKVGDTVYRVSCWKGVHAMQEYVVDRIGPKQIRTKSTGNLEGHTFERWDRFKITLYTSKTEALRALAALISGSISDMHKEIARLEAQLGEVRRQYDQINDLTTTPAYAYPAVKPGTPGMPATIEQPEKP